MRSISSLHWFELEDIRVDQIPKIRWNGFLEEVVKDENECQELCAWLFSNAPYSEDEVWDVRQVTNIGLHGDKINAFKPDSKELHTLKRDMWSKGFIEIGTIHTHPIRCAVDDFVEQHLPSEKDLKYAKRFKQLVRGIVTVDYRCTFGNKAPFIRAILFHDPFGHIICRKVDRETP